MRQYAWYDHLLALRQCLLHAVLSVAVIFLSLIYFSSTLFTHVMQPLVKHLPAQSTLIATAVTSPFLVPFKMTFMLAILIAVPFIFYQIWAFIAPALYPREKKMFTPLLSISIGLFYLGVGFAYYLVIPLAFHFFVMAAPQDVQVMTDISALLSFMTTLILAFGLTFQLPIIVIVLVRTGLVSRETLRRKRPLMIIAAFTIGMLCTPPDVISQTLLAIPLWALYEIALLLSRFYGPLKACEDATVNSP